MSADRSVDLTPCRICHYFAASVIEGHGGRCLYWNWKIRDPDDHGNSSSRKICSEQSDADPFISRLGDAIDPINLAKRHWELEDYTKRDIRTRAALAISIFSLVLSIVLVAKGFLAD